MKNLPIILFVALLVGLTSLHAENVVFGEDDASQSAYANGWNGGSNGGSGFQPWTIYAQQEEGTESHAGTFIGNTSDNKDLDEAAIHDKTFGFFANGKSFEAAAAFRRFAQLLAPGDSFSWIMKTGPFKQKFDYDKPETGSIGLTLRATPKGEKVDDYNLDSRFEFGSYEGQTNYQVFDGDTNHDSGMPVVENPIAVTFTLVTADTYNLEVTDLATKKTTKLDNRKLGGAPGAQLESFCLFDRDGETNDAYFNGLQLSKAQ